MYQRVCWRKKASLHQMHSNKHGLQNHFLTPTPIFLRKKKDKVCKKLTEICTSLLYCPKPYSILKNAQIHNRSCQTVRSHLNASLKSILIHLVLCHLSPQVPPALLKKNSYSYWLQPLHHHSCFIFSPDVLPTDTHTGHQNKTPPLQHLVSK